jgi:hypothetical protein
MADDEIVGKLARYTYANPEEEADVVYLIVQIGKIIERQGDEVNFPSLWFYRNWVVHYQLDKKGRDARTKMLDKLNDAVSAVVAYKHDEILRHLEDAVSLKNLHAEIARFVKSHRLEKPGFDYVDWFKKFDILLINILVDLPLIPPPDAGYVFEEFRFKRSNDADAEFEIKMPNKIIGGRIIAKFSGRVRT